MRIGVDLGGTKIEAIAIDGSGRERGRRRVATPVGDYAGTIRAVAAVVQAIESECGAQGTIGVAIPGTMSPASGLVKNANSTWLIGKALDTDLAAALARPVRIANDANCFALSEAVDGAGAGTRVVFGVIVGTGTGGGIVVDGQVLVGANAIAGEWGHNPLPWPRHEEWPGPQCYCGKTGCIETFLSGAGLVRAYREAGGKEGEAEAIAARAAAGEAPAVAALACYEDRMARALASVLNLLDPDVVVLGGGLSNIAALYDAVPRLWGAFGFSDRIATPLVPARHGDSSGVRGAAWLWHTPAADSSSGPEAH